MIIISSQYSSVHLNSNGCVFFLNSFCGTFVISSLITGKKLFGDGYSGLEYDYRGLINLYDSQGIFLGFLLLSELASWTCQSANAMHLFYQTKAAYNLKVVTQPEQVQFLSEEDFSLVEHDAFLTTY